MNIQKATISLLLVVGCLIAAQAQTQAQTQTQYDKGTPPQFAAGVSSVGSYMSTELGTVNLSNGALNINIPLGKIGGRGNAEVPIVLSYSSKVWSASMDVDTERESGTEQSVAFADYDNRSSFGGASAPGWTLRAGITLSSTFVRIKRTMSGPNVGCYSYGLHKLTLNLADRGEVEFRDDATDGAPLALNCSTQQTTSRGTRWHATDGSGAIFINDVDNGVGLYPTPNLSGTIILADGTRLGSTTNGAIVDRNGNRITGTLNGWTDQLGRGTTIQYGVADPANSSVMLAILITIPGYDGAPRYYKIKTGIMNVNYRSDISPTGQVITGDWDPEGWGYQWQGPHTNLFLKSYGLYAQRIDDREVLTEVVLPDGRSLKFRYNEFGEVAEVELPTGGKIQYDYAYRAALPSGNSPTWETGTNGAGSGIVTDVKWVDRGVTTKRTYPDGVNLEATWTFGYGSHTIGGTTYPATVVMATSNTSALLSQQRHIFLQAGRYTEPYSSQSLHDGTHYTLWSTGVEWRTEVLDAAGTVLSATEQDWTQRTPVSWSSYPQEQPANDNRVNQSRSYLENGMMAKTETTYDQHNNPTEVREYDFDQTLKRRTTTSYLSWNNGFNYQTNDAIHMLSLPVTTTVYNGVSTQIAQTTNEYDVYTDDGSHAPLASYGSVSQHDSSNYGVFKLTRGNVTRVGSWLNTTGTFIYSYFRFDVLGNVVSTKDANGNVTSFSFADDFGLGQNPGSPTQNPATPTYALPTLITSPPPLPGAPVHAARSQYDYSTGLLTGFRDRNNTVTQTIYNDPFNRPTQVKDALGVTGVESHTRMYYAPMTTGFGITLAKNDMLTTRDLNAVGDESIRAWTVTDGFGRIAESWTRDPQGDMKVIAVYDGLGRAKQTSNPFRPATESAVYTTTAYDLLGRVTSVTTPDNAAVTTSYVANTVTVTDQAGKSRKSVTDGLGRLIEVYEDPNGLNYLTSYTYDTLDNLVKVTQGNQLRFFMYDSLKRLLRARNPEQGTHTNLNLSDPVTANSAWSIAYEYDPTGNLTKKTDARLVESTYKYDAFSRNTEVNYSDTLVNPDVKRFYDGATNGKGRFWYHYTGGDYYTGANVEHTSVDSYDELGRPTVQRQLFKLNNTWSGAYQTSRAYNRAGGVISQTYPSLHSVSYNYDSAGRLADQDAQHLAFTGNLGDGVQRTYAAGLTYTAAGSLSRERFGTSNTPLYHKLLYNVRGQLFDTRVSSVNDLWDWNRGRFILYYSSNHLWGQSGTDNNGNVRFAETWIPPEGATLDQAQMLIEHSYDYDALNRLSCVTEQKLEMPAWVWQQQFRQAYSYDRYGNRTIDASQTWGTGINAKQFTVDTATNRLGVPGGQAGVMSYDPAGNLFTDTYTGAGTRTYDAENRMTSAADYTGQMSRYTYDADGKRTRRLIAGSQEQWQIYGFEGELLAEYRVGSPASSPEKEYGYRNGQLLVTATGRFNVALAANGAVATASSAHTCCGYSTTGAINGNNRGPWGNGEGWNDATQNQVPDWIQVAFAGDKTIDEISVFSLHDNYTQENTPTETQTFSLYGLLAFDVQYWNGSSWVTIPGGSVSGNNKVWRKFTFAPITTSKIRVHINAVPDAWSRVVEIQAFGTSAGGEKVQWLIPDHLGTPRMVIDQTGNLAGIKRHDYLPFGEELFAGTGGRTTALGYSGDGMRQQFTSQERDVETGLDYFSARYYSSTQGRFTSADPVLLAVDRVLDPQQLNLYTYVRNEPLNLLDPTGATIDFEKDQAGNLTKNGLESQEHYQKYKDFLNKDAVKYASQIATLKQLEKSDVNFVVKVTSTGFEGGEAEGRLSTDGTNVFVTIRNIGGPQGEKFSMEGRFAHEFEHARQFDDGEFHFTRGPSGDWNPDSRTYDIFDEVKAFNAQLGVSKQVLDTPMLRTLRDRRLTDTQRADKLKNIYPNRNAKDTNVTYLWNEPKGALVRPNSTHPNVFGRVHK